MSGSLFDTNVLHYLASSDPVKAKRAEAPIISGGTISVQVLNELANVCRRKMRLSSSTTRMSLSTLRKLLAVTSITVEIHKEGLALAERFKLSIYDAMVVSSALEAGCDTLWSEDLQAGMRIAEGLRIQIHLCAGNNPDCGGELLPRRPV
jgi:predicted nucleic acid-binding protein